MDDHLGTLNMAQELVSQSHAFGSTFDQSGDIRNNETTGSFQIHHTQIWIQSSEMIVGNLGSGIGYSGQKSGLTYIRKSHQSYIGNNLQFQQKFQFLCSLSRLCILRSLHGAGGIMLVTVAAFTAF